MPEKSLFQYFIGGSVVAWIVYFETRMQTKCSNKRIDDLKGFLGTQFSDMKKRLERIEHNGKSK